MLSTNSFSSRRSEFEALTVPHMDFLYNYALRLTSEPDDAADLLQETFLRAYRFWDKFEQGTNLRGWLCRIMRNSFINIYRKNSKEPKKVEYDDTGYGHVQPRNDIADESFSDEVSKALDSLPDIFKTVILLSFVEGLTYDEIAEYLNCPVGTVRSRIHRGRLLLKDNLAEFASEHGYA